MDGRMAPDEYLTNLIACAAQRHNLPDIQLDEIASDLKAADDAMGAAVDQLAEGDVAR